jgi:hypothetical protein
VYFSIHHSEIRQIWQRIQIIDCNATSTTNFEFSQIGADLQSIGGDIRIIVQVQLRQVRKHSKMFIQNMWVVTEIKPSEVGEMSNIVTVNIQMSFQIQASQTSQRFQTAHSDFAMIFSAKAGQFREVTQCIIGHAINPTKFQTSKVGE